MKKGLLILTCLVLSSACTKRNPDTGPHYPAPEPQQCVAPEATPAPLVEEAVKPEFEFAKALSNFSHSWEGTKDIATLGKDGRLAFEITSEAGAVGREPKLRIKGQCEFTNKSGRFVMNFGNVSPENFIVGARGALYRNCRGIPVKNHLVGSITTNSIMLDLRNCDALNLNLAPELLTLHILNDNHLRAYYSNANADTPGDERVFICAGTLEKRK